MTEEDGGDGVEHQDEEDDRHSGARAMKKEHDVNDAYEEEEDEDTAHASVIVDAKEGDAENATAERTRPRRMKPQKAKTAI